MSRASARIPSERGVMRAAWWWRRCSSCVRPGTPPLVREQKWDLVVVDEAHHIKNRETAGYQLVDSEYEKVKALDEALFRRDFET